jgi:hypothetical protein
MRYVVGLAAFLVLFAAWMFGAFSGTNVQFQSSDGEWSDSEVLLKGRDFEAVLVLFEVYRAKCSPTAVLQRTSEKPSALSLDHWFNDYSAAKWRVPYAAPLRAGYYRPPARTHCANQGSSAQELSAARERARRILAASAV